jgi:hypothetical protein
MLKDRCKQLDDRPFNKVLTGLYPYKKAILLLKFSFNIKKIVVVKNKGPKKWSPYNFLEIWILSY